jgi:adenylate kinase family enzyme
MSDKKPRTVLFYGMSGAGKGTQSRLLVERLNKKVSTHFVETGQLLRDYASHAGTFGARRIRDTIDAGGLVPQAVSAYMWSGVLLKSVRDDDNVVFDGAARSLKEAELFHGMLEWLGREYTIFILEINADTAKRRAVARGEGRADDNDEAMTKRLAWFNEQTLPAIEYMRGQGAQVYHINGAKDIDTVHQDILDKLDL